MAVLKYKSGGSWYDLTTGVQQDTGWRNITSLLIGGFAAQIGVYVNRSGSTVFVGVHGVWRSTLASAAFIGAAPTGFTPSGQGKYGSVPVWDLYGPGKPMAGAYLLVGDSPASWLVVENVPANIRAYGQLIYHTTDVWPGTLPGTPATFMPPIGGAQ